MHTRIPASQPRLIPIMKNYYWFVPGVLGVHLCRITGLLSRIETGLLQRKRPSGTYRPFADFQMDLKELSPVDR